jgi:DNA-binding PadR family transcriptional regulator
MAVRDTLLALLEDGPRHGYDLKQAFEAATGAVWPLNVGQVYTTLKRLERDGLVVAGEEGEDGAVPYQLTAQGRAAVRDWYAQPVERDDPPPRDELAMKLLLALTSPAAAVADVIQAQRTATLSALQEYTRLKRASDADTELPWLLVIDALILRAEAEARWLDRCEQRLVAAAAGGDPARVAAALSDVAAGAATAAEVAR